MNTPQHCQGFDRLKDLQSFMCKCPNCGTETEIFSDEFDRNHICRKCKQQIDFTKCAAEA